MTSEGKSALLPSNVDQRPPLQRGLMNFQLYKKTRISMFSSVSPRKTLRFQENKIVCFPLDQSLRIYYSLWMECLLTTGQPKSCISPARVKTWSERKNVNFTRDNFVWRHVQGLSTRVFPGSGIWPGNVKQDTVCPHTLMYGGVITHSFITCKLHLKQCSKVPQPVL